MYWITPGSLPGFKFYITGKSPHTNTLRVWGGGGTHHKPIGHMNKQPPYQHFSLSYLIQASQDPFSVSQALFSLSLMKLLVRSTAPLVHKPFVPLIGPETHYLNSAELSPLWEPEGSRFLVAYTGSLSQITHLITFLLGS